MQHTAVCLRSLFDNNTDLSFEVVIVGRESEVLDEDKLRRSLRNAARHNIVFRKFTPPKDLFLPLNPRAAYTIDIWTRIFLDQFFDQTVRRVLYLDVDVVVTGSIAALWRTDLEGALLGAVDIPGSRRGVDNLGMLPDDGYFNSGVLVFDLEQWRETDALATMLDYVRANHERLRDPDQDALNACFSGRRKRLDYIWNVIRPFYREPPVLPLPREELSRIVRDARIIHFNGAVKPWSYLSDHPRREEYWRYLRMTEWRDFAADDRNVRNMIRKSASRLLPEEVKRVIKKALYPEH